MEHNPVFRKVTATNLLAIEIEFNLQIEVIFLNQYTGWILEGIRE